MSGKEILCEQNSPEWDELRKTRITASEVHKILRSPKSAMVDQVRKRLGMGPQFFGNAATSYGHEAESVAREFYEAMTGQEIATVGFFVAPDMDWLGCSPDGITFDEDSGEMILEIKCPYSRGIPVWPLREHQAQAQAQMGITGIHKAVILYWTPAALEAGDGDKGWADFPLDFDKEAWAATLEKLKAFKAELDTIMAGDPAAWLATAGASGPSEPPREDYEWWVASEEWVEAKLALEEASAAEEQARRSLLDLAADKPSHGNGVKVSWVDRIGNVNWKALQKEWGIKDTDVDAFRNKPVRYARIDLEE